MLNKYFTRLLALIMVLGILSLTMVFTGSQPMAAGDVYSISGTKILKNGNPVELRGVNSMDVFSSSWAGGIPSMNDWNIEIIRESIDMKVTSNSKLQEIVNTARANGKVVILDAMWFDHKDLGGNTAYPNCQLFAKNPSQDSRWDAVKTRWREIANLFKNQSDVWFDVWNEPYWWDNSHGYSDDLWLSDMKALVDNIRSTGATNIVCVPCSGQGQIEDVLVSKGPTLLQGRSNILFEIHAYERWLQSSQSNVESRIQRLLDAGLAIFFGEYAPHNSGNPPVMDVTNFLNAVRNKRITTTAWLWKSDSDDENALKADDGVSPNNNNNGGYGSEVKNYLKESHPYPSSGTPTPSPTPAPTSTPAPSTGKVEAEDMTLSNYTVESNSAASGGEVIKTNGTGTAQYTFGGASGTYNIKVSYFDENDGNSTYKLYVGSTVVDQWTANQNLGASSANSNTLTSRTKNGVSINNGQIIKIEGVRDNEEYARVDYIETTSSSTPTATPTPTPTGTPTLKTYQAEDYTSSNDCTVKNSFGGYTGTGYIDYGEQGAYIEWNNVNVSTAGTYTLTFRFSNGSSQGNRTGDVYINGVDRADVTFEQTGSWDTWQTVTASVQLNAGNNTVRLTASSSNGGPNLDKLEVN